MDGKVGCVIVALITDGENLIEKANFIFNADMLAIIDRKPTLKKIK
jgi:hypothetical protein